MADFPCMKNRSLKAGLSGRLNRWSLKAGFTVLERETEIVHEDDRGIEHYRTVSLFLFGHTIFSDFLSQHKQTS